MERSISTRVRRDDALVARASGSRFSAVSRAGQRVPLLWLGKFQAEGFGQVQRGLVRRQAVDGGPQVEDVALSAALSVEAAEHVLVERGRERLLAITCLSMYRAG